MDHRVSTQTPKKSPFPPKVLRGCKLILSKSHTQSPFTKVSIKCRGMDLISLTIRAVGKLYIKR